MARMVYGWLLLLLGYFFLTHSMVHQWMQPPLIYPEADNTYWLLHLLNIPQLIMRSPVISLLFDLVFLFSVIGFFLLPEQVFLAAVSIACLWLFQIMYGSANGHHYHHIGYLLVPLPFLFRDRKKFNFSWQLVRYWILFLFTCSGLYKIYYGGFFQPDNMSSILKMHTGAADATSGQWNLYLVGHPSLAQFLYQGATLLQLSCVLGFISHRFDRIIFYCLLMFNLANMLLLGIPFWENLLILLPFVHWPMAPGKPAQPVARPAFTGKDAGFT